MRRVGEFLWAAGACQRALTRRIVRSGCLGGFLWQTEHLSPKGLFVGFMGVVESHESAVVEDKDAITKCEQLGHFRRDQQDRGSLCSELK